MISGGPISGQPISSLIEEAATPEPEPEAVESVTGGWLSEAQVRALWKQVRKAERAARKRGEQKERDKERLRASLEEAWDEVMGIARSPAPSPTEAAGTLAAVVAPYAQEQRSDGAVPWVLTVDWQTLVLDLDAVRALVAALQAMHEDRLAWLADEEDAIAALVLA